MAHYQYKKYCRPRQEISRILKYIIFLFNFVFWLCGMACTGLGVYLYASDFRPLLELMDLLLNPAMLLLIIGTVIFIVSFLGCTGALRENLCMLRAFSFCLFLCYVSLVVVTFAVFFLFYSDAKTGLSMQSILLAALRKYHDSKNTAEIMNTMQNQLGCCGVTSSGYKDWNENSLYNCSRENIAPERCGVPFSCCKKPSSPTTASVALLPSDSSLNAYCGFGAQEKSTAELQNLIYVDGCLHPFQKIFEGHAVIIGSIIAAVIIPVCISVTFSNILAKQIDHQRYLLSRQARREEKRRRRERSSKYTDAFFDQVPGVVVQRIENLRKNSTCLLDSTLPPPPPPTAVPSPLSASPPARQETAVSIDIFPGASSPAGLVVVQQSSSDVTRPPALPGNHPCLTKKLSRPSAGSGQTSPTNPQLNTTNDVSSRQADQNLTETSKSDAQKVKKKRMSKENKGMPVENFPATDPAAITNSTNDSNAAKKKRKHQLQRRRAQSQDDNILENDVSRVSHVIKLPEQHSDGEEEKAAPYNKSVKNAAKKRYSVANF